MLLAQLDSLVNVANKAILQSVITFRRMALEVIKGLFVRNPPITLETGNDLNTDKAEEIEKVRNEPKTPETAKKRHWWQRR